MAPVPKSILAMGGTAAAACLAGAIFVAWSLSSPSPSPVAPPRLMAAPVTPAAAPQAAIPAPPPPSFDVARVEATGEAVVAGRAPPNAAVALLDNGVKIADGKADANGQFVILPPRLTPGDHALSLRADGVDSAQTVAMAVPKTPGGTALAALAEPNRPTRLLSGAPRLDAAHPVAIASAEAGEDGAFFASGAAAPGASLRLYLNNAFVAPVTASPDGEWSLKINRGMAPGHYDIRADVVAPAKDEVIARAEAPFDYPATLASESAPRVQVAAATPGQAVVEEIQSVTVVRGDSLWRISRHVLGHGARYTQIYEANASQIRDPNKIWPGQVFVAPRTQTN